MPHLYIVGGSDAGIAAALAARQQDDTWDVTVALSDRYPNYSICGLPFYLSGETPDWRTLAHRSSSELTAAGISLALETTALDVDVLDRRVTVTHNGHTNAVAYDELIIATGAMPARPPIPGLDLSGVVTLHTMADAFAVHDRLATARRVIIIGGGYIGCELADAFSHRHLEVTLIEALPEVLTTVDAGLGRRVRTELMDHGVRVLVDTTVKALRGSSNGLVVDTTGNHSLPADMVAVAVGVTPNSALGRQAGIPTGARGALIVDRRMRTGVPHVWAAGDCVETWLRLTEQGGYLPLGTTAHKQGRVAGTNAVGGDRCFPGALGTQVVQVFDLAIARTGLRDGEAEQAGFQPRTVETVVDDHKAYYPGATSLRIRLTGDLETGRLLGAQMVGHRTSQVAKRVDVYAAALHLALGVEEISDLDLSYTPPYASPWDAVQMAAERWILRPSSDFGAQV